MGDLLRVLAAIVTVVWRCTRPGGVKALVAENVALRQQLLVLSRDRRRCPPLKARDRLVLGLSTLFIRPARLVKVAVAVRPSTLLRFHRALVHRKYRALFTPKTRPRPRPKGPSPELKEAIVAIKVRNPRFGCPRIADIISRTFGIDIDKDVVRRVLAQSYRPDSCGRGGPSWLTFLGHTKDSLWSVDFFRCESVLLWTYWVLLVLDQHTRRIVGFGVQREAVDGPNACRMLNAAIGTQELPSRISSDHDPLLRSHRWQAHLRVLDIEEIKTVAGVPLSHPFVERAIGTIRREFLEHTLFWNSVDLERKLEVFREYYNNHRVHSGIDGQTPRDVVEDLQPAHANLQKFRWASHARGLVELPLAA